MTRQRRGGGRREPPVVGGASCRSRTRREWKDGGQSDRGKESARRSRVVHASYPTYPMGSGTARACSADTDEPVDDALGLCHEPARVRPGREDLAARGGEHLAQGAGPKVDASEPGVPPWAPKPGASTGVAAATRSRPRSSTASPTVAPMTSPTCPSSPRRAPRRCRQRAPSTIDGCDGATAEHGVLDAARPRGWTSGRGRSTPRPVCSARSMAGRSDS